jgi:hypothetical protein
MNLWVPDVPGVRCGTEAYELFWRYPERWTLQAYGGRAG